MNNEDEKLFWDIVKEDTFMNSMQELIDNDIKSLELDSDKLVKKTKFIENLFSKRKK